MKLNEKTKITMDALNSGERSYENLIMRFLAGSGKAAPGYRMEILGIRREDYHSIEVEVAVYMPRQRTPYASYNIGLSRMNVQIYGNPEPVVNYYRGSYEEFRKAEMTAYIDCMKADVIAA